MALHRGIQSAIFYYLSCAPCAEARYRKKRKQDAVRGRAERAALEAEMPDVYRHPSPSSTNPYWQTEIAAGPVLVSRGKKKGNASASGRQGVKTSYTQRSNESDVPSSLDLSQRNEAGTGSRDGRVDSRWQFQQFQRDDEPYSYASRSVERMASSSTLDGSASQRSAGLARPAKVKLRPAPDGYLEARNPEISDRHPAIARKISSKEEAAWLMAPPPTADFMSGKDRGTRSRSDSGGSSKWSARSGVPLSREVSRRLMEQKWRHGDAPLTPSLSRESTMGVQNDPTGQRHDRRNIGEKDFALEDGLSRSTTQHPSPVLVGASEDSMDSSQTVIRSPDLAAHPRQTRRAISKPELSTIVSDESPPPNGSEVHHPRTAHTTDVHDASINSNTERDRISRRAPLLFHDESLQTLYELAPASAILKRKPSLSRNVSRDSVPKRTESRINDGREDKKLEVRPEMFDSWYTPDFELPQWIHEHTKREVTQRWSMDI